jgi:hypothetical protein
MRGASVPLFVSFLSGEGLRSVYSVHTFLGVGFLSLTLSFSPLTAETGS